MADQGVQRRLAAILAADVAGYTRLMEDDTDGTVAAWQVARDNVVEPFVSDHSGKIVKLTGDGFLVEFPTVQDAVKCAKAMQERLASNTLNFRMGVNLGDIIDDGQDIHGEGVNIAARLEGLADPGGICISASVHEQVRNRLDYRVEDMGEVEVKNVSEPIHVFRVLIGGEDAQKIKGSTASKRRMALAGIATLVIIAASVFGWRFIQAPEPKPESQAMAPANPARDAPEKSVLAARERSGIAVLPFVNISDNKEQEYFADGMTEDLITDLSKILTLNVISRTSISGYKGKKINIREVGKALSVRYVVEGSVRKAGKQVRINAQLIDAGNGSHLWAERYDGNLNDIFALQDRVLEKIVSSLALKLSEKERKRLAAKGTSSIEAHDLYMRGLFEESRFTREANKRAVVNYEKAIAIDPDYALPYTRIGNILQLNARNGWTENVQADLKKGAELAKKAIVLDPQDPYLHWSLGRNIARIKTPENLRRGIKALERAIQLNPYYADAFAFLAVLYASDGRAEEGFKSVEKAMKLNPRYPFWYLLMRGMTRYVVADYEAAISDFETAAERSPTAMFVRWWLAASYAQIGQQDDAEWQVEEMNSLGFKSNIRTIIDTGYFQDPTYVARYKEGLRKAGIPDE